MQVPTEDLKLLAQLKAEWSSLYDFSLYRKLTMEPAKAVFAKTTKQLITDFVNECEVFAKKFREEGPGADQHNLEQGFNLMEVLIFKIMVNILYVVLEVGMKFPCVLIFGVVFNVGPWGVRSSL